MTNNSIKKTEVSSTDQQCLKMHCGSAVSKYKTTVFQLMFTLNDNKEKLQFFKKKCKANSK